MHIKFSLFKNNKFVLLWVIAFYKNDFTFRRIRTNTEVESYIGSSSNII